MARRLDIGDSDFEEAFAALIDEKRNAQADVDEAVEAILAEVKARGDAAVLEYTERFDGVRLSADEMRVPPAEFDAAESACASATSDALHFAAERIEAFHRRQMPADFTYTDAAGVELGARWRPLAVVGIYVPGGTAAYPSSVLMNALPARVAGVSRVVMVVPAPRGALDTNVLAAATKTLPGPTILSTGAIVSVPKASAAMAWAPPMR